VEAACERDRLLADLEFMQNDLLVRLDDLDHRVSQALKQWTAVRQAELTPGAVSPAGPGAPTC